MLSPVTAYAYLRKSRLMRDQETISPEMQLAAVREYARTDDLVVLTDLNKSGTKGRRDRPGFDALLTAIETGACTAVYSYSLSRLSRSVRDIMALADLCRAHSVPIRLARDTDPDPTTATGRAVLALLGVMAQLEADLAQERSLDAIGARRQRGDRLGRPLFENHEAVVEAYREARTLHGAARLLAERGVRTRAGGMTWQPSAVRVVLRRAAPELLPAKKTPGVKHAAPFTYFRLLRCHCGYTLSGWRNGQGRAYYTCLHGRTQPGHGRTNIGEPVIQEWAEREMTRLRPPTEEVALAESTAAESRALEARVDRLRVAFLAGLIEEAAMLAEKADIDAALTRLDLQGRAVRVPPFSWDHEPRDLNLALRALWDHVQLDRDLRPARAEWLVPDSWLGPPAPELLAAPAG